MNARGLYFAAMTALSALSAPCWAQGAADAGVAFGSRLTLANLVSTLQSGGYQALVAAPHPAPGTAAPLNMIGLITTGIGGVKVIVVANRCPNSKTDDICSINLLSSFKDDKSLINDATLDLLNQRSSMVKVLPQKRDGATTGFTLIYAYVCKDFDDPKFIVPVLASFGADVGTVLKTYNGLAAPAAAKP